MSNTSDRKSKSQKPTQAARQSHKGRNNSNNIMRRRPPAPYTSNNNNITSQKLTQLVTKMSTLGQEILTMILDNLSRTELDGPSAILVDHFRTRLTRYIRDALKITRKYDSRQQDLMRQLIALRANLPNFALVKFYEAKEELVKQHQELKCFMKFCESRLQLIRLYNGLTDNQISTISNIENSDNGNTPETDEIENNFEDDGEAENNDKSTPGNTENDILNDE